MGVINQNPTISKQANIGSPLLLYIADGAAIFGCIGSPEGAIWANKRSLALSDDGSVYFKTTDDADTGWIAISGGGGGSVTSFAAGNLSPLFTASVANPTTTPTLSFAPVSQLQNLFYASPNGSSGNPSFRAIVTADLAGVALASPPSASVQFNNGTNGFLGDPDFTYDAASGTLQLGVAGSRVGKLDLRGAVSGSVRFTVDQPAANPITYQIGNSLPSTGDLWRAANVTGNTITMGFVAPSSLGFASVNPTTNVLPYNNAGVFADSPLQRLSATAVGFSSAATGTALAGTVIGVGGLGAQWLSVGRGNSVVTGSGVVASDFYVNQFNNNNSSMRVGIRYDQGIFLGSGMDLTWTNAADNTPTPTRDSGVNRRTAGVLRITNGSTGAGSLLLGTSTGTASGRLHVDAVSTGVIPIYVFCESGATQPAIEAVNFGSLIFRAGQSGKLQFAANLVQVLSAIGNAKSDVATIGNVGTGLDNLLSVPLPGKSLNNTGDYAEIDAFGEFENNANNKTLQIVFGSTTIFNTGAIAFGSAALANWRTNTKIIRTGATSQKIITTFWSNDASTPFLQEIFIAGEDLTTNKTIQFKGEGTSTDDVTQLALEMKITVAQTS